MPGEGVGAQEASFPFRIIFRTCYLPRHASPQLIPTGSKFPLGRRVPSRITGPECFTDKETEAGEVRGSGGGQMGPQWPGATVRQLRCSLPSLAGAQYWVYNGEKPVLGPAPLSELGLLGSPIQAALAWGPEKNKIYFFGGGDYWRFHLSTRRVDSPVPRRATDWRGVPSEIDAAFRDADGALGWSGLYEWCKSHISHLVGAGH